MVVVEPGDRIHFLDWGGPVRRTPGRPAHPRPVEHGLVVGAGRAPAARASGTWSRWTCAATACPTPRPRATTRRPSAGDVVAVAEGSGPAGRRRRPGRPGRPRVRGDRRGVGRRRARRALRRARPRRRRLGVDRGRQRDGRRRVPARPRRAARGHALDDGVPRRPRRRSTRRRGTPTRSAPPGRPSSRRTPARSCPSTRPHAAGGERPGDVPLRPAGDARGGRRRRSSALAAADDEAGSRAAALAAASAARAAAGRGRDPRGVVRARRAQPDALPSGGGQRGDPVDRRRDRQARGRGSAMQVVYSPAHLGPRHHDRDVHGRRRSRPTRSPSGPS